MCSNHNLTTTFYPSYLPTNPNLKFLFRRDFLAKKGTKVNIEELKKYHPKLMNFEEWAMSQDMDKKKLDKPSSCVIA